MLFGTLLTSSSSSFSLYTTQQRTPLSWTLAAPYCSSYAAVNCPDFLWGGAQEGGGGAFIGWGKMKKKKVPKISSSSFVYFKIPFNHFLFSAFLFISIYYYVLLFM
jgi:hypothetical protein